MSGLKPFDTLMSGFVAKNQVLGASLAVTRGRKVVYSRGFGFADLARTRPVEPDALFRIASVSKPFTSVAVLRLARAGKLSLSDPVLKHVKVPVKDERWRDVTVQHCLNHRSGMDRDKSGDPIGMVRKIAADLKCGYPVSAENVMRWAMLRPLDADPGTAEAYSNIGYLVLGRVIEAVTGEKYEAHVRRAVLEPVGIKEMQIGHALPELRAKGEVEYLHRQGGTGPCLFPPKVGQQVPWPDGAENVEGFEAHGGWIASATDLVKFASDFDEPGKSKLLDAKWIETMFAKPPGTTEDVRYACGWQVRPAGRGLNTWHNGFIAGTSTLLVRRWDGLCWAALFNTDVNAEEKVLSGLIDGPLHGAADRCRW